MTLKELIDKAIDISVNLESNEIPVIYNGVSDTLTRLELGQDNDGNYYVNIMQKNAKILQHSCRKTTFIVCCNQVAAIISYLCIRKLTK